MPRIPRLRTPAPAPGPSQARLPSVFDDIGDGESDSLSRQAFRRLRDQIVTLQRQPGAPLLESSLVNELQLGRTPIREALHWLACQGLVEVRQWRGAYVAPIHLTDLMQIFELRQELEGYAARLAAERAAESDLKAMRLALDPLSAPGQTPQAQECMEVDRAFHAAVAQAAHNRFLRGTLARLYDLNLRLWFLALDRIGPMAGAVAQHEAVLRAIEARDATAAEAALRAHIVEFQERIRAVM